MNNKLRDELANIIDENVYNTNYIASSLEDIKESLVGRGLGEAEANMIAASVKYIIGLRNYEKPTLTPVQKQRVCDYWSHVRSLDTLVGVWGDMSTVQLTRKLDKIKIYTHSYIDYILHNHPEIIYIPKQSNNKYGNKVKKIKVTKLVDILYNDYLEIKEELENERTA